MSITVMAGPRDLYQSADKAHKQGMNSVEIEPSVLMESANQWDADRKKIQYLESLIVRIARGNEE